MIEKKIKQRILAPREFRGMPELTAWIRELFDAGLNYHPDTEPADYVDSEGNKTFTMRECEALQLLEQNASASLGWDSLYHCGLDAWSAWAVDNGLMRESPRHRTQGHSKLQQAARDLTDYVANPKYEAYIGTDPREACRQLCECVGIPEPEWKDDEEE